MQLSEAEIKEFQTIVKEDYGIDLGYDKAYEGANKLISLMEIVLEFDDLKGGKK